MSKNKITCAIIGCGLIGSKRANNLGEDYDLLYAVDTNLDLAKKLSKNFIKQNKNVHVVDNYSKILSENKLNTVFIATPNHLLYKIAKACVENGKNVLIEKPGALKKSELEDLLNLSSKNNTAVRIGFNHRYHPAFIKAHELFEKKYLGELMFVRARYGHGGRVGYDKEWRADPKLSGGGELIDQGVHLIDLASWFLGNFDKIEGHAKTYFWDMTVDDNAFLNLQTKTGQTAWLQVSCTEWKNMFSFEIYGKDAKLHIEGLGGSYGVEKLTYYRMLPEMGPPETKCWEFPRGDQSWKIEMQEFANDIKLNRSPKPGLQEGIKVLNIVEEIYRKSGYNFS